MWLLKGEFTVNLLINIRRFSACSLLSLSAFILFLFSLSNNCLNIFFSARTLTKGTPKDSFLNHLDRLNFSKAFHWCKVLYLDRQSNNLKSWVQWRILDCHVFVIFQYLCLWLYKSKPTTLVVFYPDIASQIKCLIIRCTILKNCMKSPIKINFEESYFKLWSLTWINFRGVIRRCRVIMHLLMRCVVNNVLRNLNQTF